VTSSLQTLSALQIGALIQAGAMSARDVAEATLAACEACEDKAVFTRLTSERALAEADLSDRRRRERRPLGPLDGVPVAWKDLFDLAGIVTTAGSKVLAGEAPAQADAPVVTRLKAAGMVTIGKTGMNEFAFSGIGINPHYGTPHNPHGADTPRVPGGSSSGSAVAVARGLVPVAIGTDTGGSVRIPAAFNGIVGYKATRGRYPMEGVFPLARSFDSLGPLCRCVADAVAIDAAMRGLAAPTMTPRSLAGQKIIVPGNILVAMDYEAQVLAAFEGALTRLAAAGALIEWRALPALDAVLDIARRAGGLATREAYLLHEKRLNGPEAAAMDHRVVFRMRHGAETDPAAEAALVARRADLIRETRKAIGAGTLIAFPTVTHVAPPIAPLEADDNLFVATNGRTLRNTMLGNFLDWCGVSIPCGTGEAKMPIGFLLSALGQEDTFLLAAALAAEETIRG